MIRTRFAPSPTGFLHLGGARTALFSWAYAKKNNGTFILRIEDTDQERSSEVATQSIIQAMNWLGLAYDEGPYYQTQRIARYKEIIQQLLASGHAYRCYCSKEDLENMRNHQRTLGLKPKYDRRCLSRSNQSPQNNQPHIVRFKNPDTGSVIWRDLVKGNIEINNSELDDLVILKADGFPTYNFCVVVDDLDMQITHVIRGDDHVNNTPRQINIFKALNASIPSYSHVPMILRDDGQKMSKRTDAVSVIEYKDMGILPEALLNYLARLCWGHGDDEFFTLDQFISWFDLQHISNSPARFDMKKLLWLNARHIKSMPKYKLTQLVYEDLNKNNELISNSSINLESVVELLKERSDNLVNLVHECAYFYQPQLINNLDKVKYLTPDANKILVKFAHELSQLETWEIGSIKQTIKDFCNSNNIKMPHLGMPLRLKLCGTTQTPSFDAVIYVLGKSEVLSRLLKPVD
jgi:glutamyl-tRNA synthetase